jgi:hypothetical protein
VHRRPFHGRPRTGCPGSPPVARRPPLSRACIPSGPGTGGALMAVVTRAVRRPGAQGGRGLPGVRRSGTRPGRPCGDAAVLLVSGLSGISVRSAGREAGGDWGLRLAAALSVWQGGRRRVTRPGRAVNGICARRRTWRVPGAGVEAPGQAVTADGMAGPRKACRRVLPAPDGQSGVRGRSVAAGRRSRRARPAWPPRPAVPGRASMPVMTPSSIISAARHAERRHQGADGSQAPLP